MPLSPPDYYYITCGAGKSRASVFACWLSRIICEEYTLGSSPDSLLASEAANDELRERSPS